MDPISSIKTNINLSENHGNEPAKRTEVFRFPGATLLHVFDLEEPNVACNKVDKMIATDSMDERVNNSISTSTAPCAGQSNTFKSQENALNCPQCMVVFNCCGLKDRHSQLKHGISKPHYCKMCNAGFHEADEFHRHIELHKNLLHLPTCRYCNQIFEFQSDLDAHLQINGSEGRASFKNAENYLGDLYLCRNCNKKFFNETQLHHHLEMCTESTKELCREPEYFYCDFCDYKGVCEDSFEMHKKIHSTEYRYKCEICGKIFSTMAYVQMHKNIHNAADTSYQCCFCGVPYYSLGILNQHIKRKHSNIAPTRYICKICDKVLCDPVQFQFHLEAHTVDEKPYKCCDCDLQFESSRTLDQHKLIHVFGKLFNI